MSFCKGIVVVDETVDPKDSKAVMRELLTKLDITADIIITRGVLDVLDHSAPMPLYGSKIGVDLTARLPGEPQRKGYNTRQTSLSPQEAFAFADKALEGIISCFPINAQGRNRVILFGVEKRPDRGGRYFAHGLLALQELSDYNIIVLFDKEIQLSDNSLVLWKFFNNVDPERDFYCQNNRLIIDACRKGVMDEHTREWPSDITMEG